jgi:hypothetical protein
VFDNYNNDNFCAAAREARATRAPASLALQGCKARAKRAALRSKAVHTAKQPCEARLMHAVSEADGAIASLSVGA